MALVRQCDKCKQPFKEGIIEGKGTVNLNTTYSTVRIEIKVSDVDMGVDGRATPTTTHPDYCLPCLVAMLPTDKKVSR
jgi:hypothetical protein